MYFGESRGAYIESVLGKAKRGHVLERARTLDRTPESDALETSRSSTRNAPRDAQHERDACREQVRFRRSAVEREHVRERALRGVVPASDERVRKSREL